MPNNGVRKGENEFFGKYIILENSEKVYYLYGNLSSINTAYGDHVKVNDMLGMTSSTVYEGSEHVYYEKIVNNNTMIE